MGAHRHDSLKTRRLLGGWTIGDLAKAARVSDRIIKVLEDGGTCTPRDSRQILDAMAPTVTLTSNTQASPTVFTTATAHLFQTGDGVTIAGNTGSNADPNGSRVVTRIDGTSFSVVVNCTTAGGTGGTAAPNTTITGLASLV